METTRAQTMFTLQANLTMGKEQANKHMSSNFLRKHRYNCDEYTLVKSSTVAPFTSIVLTRSVSLASSTNDSFVFGNSTSEMVTGRNTTPGANLQHLILLYSLVFIVSVIGNVLVLITLGSNRRMRTVTNCFLLSLALSDLMLVLFCMPISLIGRILKEFIFGPVLCRILPYFMGISVSVSTFTMLAISIERYNAICSPLKSRGWQTKSHAYKVIAAVWLVSALIMSPFLFFSQLRYMPILKQQKCTLTCRLQFGKPEARQVWYVLQILVLFCIPGVLMTIAYIKVCLQIYHGFQFEANSAKTKSLDANGRAGRSFKSRNSGNDSVTTKFVRETNTDASKVYLQVEKSKPLLHQSNSSRTFHRESRINQNAAQLKSKKRVVRMLIVIVVLFFVCWTPLFVVNVWKAFDPKGARKNVEGSIEIIQLMSYISTCVNPVIYCFMNKKFRDGFVRAFLCCLPASCARSVERKPSGAVSGMSITETPTTHVSMVMTSPRNLHSTRRKHEKQKVHDDRTAQMVSKI